MPKLTIDEICSTFGPLALREMSFVAIFGSRRDPVLKKKICIPLFTCLETAILLGKFETKGGEQNTSFKKSYWFLWTIFDIIIKYLEMGKDRID